MTVLIEYLLTCPVLCLGERKKKGTYRSSVLTIPYSQITGALEAKWGNDSNDPIHAVGLFLQPDPDNQAEIDAHTETHVYARRDLAVSIAVLPIETKVLTDVKCRIFVVRNSFTEQWGKDSFQINMGAYRQKGLGNCLLKYTTEHSLQKAHLGKLLTRIPEDLLAIFGIEQVHLPQYGYLFRPDNGRESGSYVRSLMEGSVVTGPPLLVKAT